MRSRVETPEQAARRKLADDLSQTRTTLGEASKVAAFQLAAIDYKETLEGAGERLSIREHRLINGFVDYLITRHTVGELSCE